MFDLGKEMWLPEVEPSRPKGAPFASRPQATSRRTGHPQDEAGATAPGCVDRPSSMRTLPAEVVELAHGQRGALTTAQARSQGLLPSDLVELTARRQLEHPFRGVYTLPPPPDEEDEARHLRLCAALRLLYPQAALTSVSAVLAHGTVLSGADLSRPALRWSKDRGTGVRGAVFRRSTGPVVQTTLGATTALPQALVEVAMDAGPVAGVVSADHALHAHAVTLGDLAAAVDAVRSWPRAGRARTMLSLVDGRSESVGESRTRCQLSVAGIVAVPQVEISDRDGEVVARVDLLVDDWVVVEFDGRVKYADGDPSVLWREKKREDTLRRLGYVVVRVTWADLRIPGKVAAMVRTARQLVRSA